MAEVPRGGGREIVCPDELVTVVAVVVAVAAVVAAAAAAAAAAVHLDRCNSAILDN